MVEEAAVATKRKAAGKVEEAAAAPKRAKGRSKGRKSSRIVKEPSESDAEPSGESEEREDTPLGTEQPPMGGNITLEAVPAAADSANPAAAATSSQATSAAPTVVVLSGGSEQPPLDGNTTAEAFPAAVAADTAIGSRGTSWTSFRDNINRFRVPDWFLGAGFPFDPR
jgi:hypothetical protein